MRILWLCNILLPAIASKMGLPYSNREGWLSGVYNRLQEEKKGIELGICFPVSTMEGMERFIADGVICYGFIENLDTPEQYDVSIEKRFIRILEDFKPDMVHVFGTEFPHTLAMVKVFRKPERTLIGIQGLCYKIGEVYADGIPESVVNRRTFRDFIKRDSIIEQKDKFISRGRNEMEAIKGVGHITGRTAFDRQGAKAVNPEVVYHPMNETMRDCFYTGRWNPKICEKHSVFLSQGDYPIKGFHLMLKAMPLLLRQYPDTHLYVAGNSVIRDESWKDKLKISSYGKYLLQMIKEYDLKEKVTVLGKLNAQEMKERFLKSSVFVCPSLIENSPNAVCEAMLLGVPVVAAKVGGIPDLIKNGENGILYEVEHIAALAQGILQAWQEEVACKISEKAAEGAAKVHDRAANYNRLIEIYHKICDSSKHC